MDKVVQTGTMGGVRYEVHKVEKLLTTPLYYAVLKYNNGDEVPTRKTHYRSECLDFVRTELAEESFYG